ncbi:MAG: hypothetical protein II537_00100 [Bacteroidales bacterium]|nr:hypothetical protein [Bacteroidales bacterium]
MKRILALLSLVLFPIISVAQTSEPEWLSFSREYHTPRMKAELLYDIASKWGVDRKIISVFHLYGLNFNHDPFSFIITDQAEFRNIPAGFLQTYSVSIPIMIACYDGRYIIEISKIDAVVGTTTFSKHFDYLPADESLVRKLPYYRGHYRKLKAWLENYFNEVSASLYANISAHAEVELK